MTWMETALGGRSKAARASAPSAPRHAERHLRALEDFNEDMLGSGIGLEVLTTSMITCMVGWVKMLRPGVAEAS